MKGTHKGRKSTVPFKYNLAGKKQLMIDTTQNFTFRLIYMYIVAYQILVLIVLYVYYIY